MNHDDPGEIPLDRRRELLADRALGGLGPAEAAELAQLPPAADSVDLAFELELAAAAASLARLETAGIGDLPADLAARLASQAVRPVRSVGSVAPTPPRRSPPRSRRAGWLVPWAGWLAAAAALALLARDRGQLPPPSPPPPGPPIEAQPPPRPNPVRAAPAVRLVASDHPLARGAGGTIAWDEARQEGLIRPEGLAPVDPKTGCYQLWIFDATRDPRYPVDGGTFTVAAGGRPEGIAIRPRVPVRTPTLFAITLEPSGGVVVSDRERIILTAAWNP